MIATQPKPQFHPPITPTQVLLSGIAWETFQGLIRDLESQPGRRLTYSDGALEIWMPDAHLKAPHERYKKFLARLVEILTEELDIEVCSLGSCTWNRRDLAKGVEADECYYIQNESVIRGRMEIDLEVDPPPDLAIEVDITSLSIPRLPIYAALGVPEVWRFDGERLEFLSLVAGEYGSMEQSLALPGVKPDDLMMLLGQVSEMGETSWAKFVRRWVRDNF